ncbi:MAG: hypothetical protein LBJ17_00425 [Dysgonamonadaceae bacterium]|jgi:hypothetical protein|nr:hypothetical protein [Dysgonamonadaceae bacterium]
MVCPLVVLGQNSVVGGHINDLLVKTGFEDVAVIDEPETVFISYSDHVYRGPFRGALEAFRLLLNESVHKNIHLILQENRLPVVVLKLSGEQVNDYLDKKLSLAQLMSFVQISADVDEYIRLFGKAKRENHSAGKVDLVVYPQISLNNSWMDKLYGGIFNIAPAVEVGLWKGASFTGQVIFPIWNNMNGEMDYIRAGMLLFRQEYRFPKNVFMAFHVGNFNASRMGVDISAKYISDNDRWQAGMNAGLTGSSTFYFGKWAVSQWKRNSGAVFFRYNEPTHNLQFDLTGQRYIYGDYGVRLDCTRHFGEVAIGFYGMYSGGEANGGFHFAVPLPGQKRMKRQAVRIYLPEYFDWEYGAQSGRKYTEQRLGRSYETRPDENRSQRYYTPSYMKEMLVKLAKEK